MAKEINLPEENLTGLDKLQELYEKNSTAINAGLAVVLLVLAGLLYYVKVMQPKAEIAAQEAIFQSQYHFENDEYQLALSSGLLDVSKKYGSTKAGKLANYYAGISYFNLGDYNSAIFYLKKFNSKDELLNALALGALADAQMETNDVSAALSNFKKAATTTKNEAIAPVLLFKAGLAHELNGKKQDANKFYTEIKEKYPNSDQALEIDKYIGRAEAGL
jgi:TolA-binding protein